MKIGIDLDPWSREELLASHADTNREVSEAGIVGAQEAFFHRPEKAAWSGAEHMAHLVTSVNAVAKGLTIKRLALRLLFGRASGESRRFAGVREAYLAQLAAGGRASGRFVPAQKEPPVGAIAAQIAREELLARWQRAVGRLEKGLRCWDEAALDHYRLPHPLLGKLTVREMLLFTIYHNLHHARRVRDLGQINC